MSEGRRAVLALVREAKIRGDIGKPEGPEVWDWLQWWADKHYPAEQAPSAPGEPST